MRLLGIDPGTRVVGYGLIDLSGSRLSLVAAGALRPPPQDPVERRLAFLHDALGRLLAEHRPAVAAIEDAFVKADARAALAIGLGRGALLAALGAAGLEVASYPPATVKRAVAGSGKAEKPRVARMVAAILGLPAPPDPLDATDALAVAICHAARFRSQALLR